MPVCPTGDLKDLGLGCFTPSWWHLSISAVCFIAVKIQAVQPNVGCVLEYSQERRSIPRGFVFPLQSSLVTDVAWPQGLLKMESKFAITMGRKRRSKLQVITT